MRAPAAAAAIAMVAGIVACAKAKSPPAANATVQECTAYRDKMFGFLPATERDGLAGIGMDKPTPLELQLCQQRMTSDEIACALAATTQADALACKPKVDIRPDDAKRTAEECAAFREHVGKLAKESDAGNGMGPPLTTSLAAMFSRECERWQTKKRYDCVMKAQTAMDLTMCKP